MVQRFVDDMLHRQRSLNETLHRGVLGGPYRL
jgi:hypothetical protein